MASLEAEFERALVARGSALMDAAATGILYATMSPTRDGELVHPSWELVRLREAAEALERAEALTAVFLQRCGASWDVLASHFEVSKQALHRRLAARGEAEYVRAQRYHGLFAEDLENNARYVRSFVAAGLVSDLPNGAAQAARQLAALRRGHRWWAAG